MTKRIQVLSKEGLQLDVVNKDGTISNKTIVYMDKVEITDNCLKGIEHYKPNSYRLIDKPKPRYYNVWIVGIGCTIIGTIIGKIIL